MIRLKVEVPGGDEMAARLSMKGDAVRVRLQKEMAEIGTGLLAEARSRAPVGRGRKSKASRAYGPLREALRKRAFSSQGLVGVKVDLGKAWYGRIIETGRKARAARPGASVRRQRGASYAMPPRPFMRPAFQSQQASIMSRLNAAVAEVAGEGG